MGLRELRTQEEVDNIIASNKGAMLLYINSACGCAAGVAVPALEMALRHEKIPGTMATVFATTDKEATAQARSYFLNEPPSSPSFAMMRDGKFMEIIHRSSIQHNTPDNVSFMLREMFDRHCG